MSCPQIKTGQVRTCANKFFSVVCSKCLVQCSSVCIIRRIFLFKTLPEYLTKRLMKVGLISTTNPQLLHLIKGTVCWRAGGHKIIDMN